MAQPQRKQYPLAFAGALDEVSAPQAVGLAGGLTAGSNVMYRRAGALGQRPAPQLAFKATTDAVGAGAASGTHWVQTVGPNAGKYVVVSYRGTIYVAPDNIGSPAFPSSLAPIATYTGGSVRTPLAYASTFDPAANNGTGADVLVICGATTATNSFASSAALPPYVTGALVAGDVLTLTMQTGLTSVAVTYTVLASDNQNAIINALVRAVNASLAVIPGAPFLAQALPIIPDNGIVNQLQLYALVSGNSANGYQYSLTSTNGGFTGGPKTLTNLSGGGNAWSGPLKFDGATISGLSGAISTAFTGCTTWHNHLWLWGDPLNPSTLYATDINTAEGWNFMTTQGAYQIGRGDGDTLRDCQPIGGLLYLFKETSIFALSGYDFQGGEYAFNIQPAIQGVGVVGPNSVAPLRNALVFWSGSQFYRLAPGAVDVEPIGTPIPLTMGALTDYNQSAVRAVAGSYLATTLLNNRTGTSPAPVAFSNLAFFSFAVSAEAPFLLPTWNAVLAYNDDATQILGHYAWAQWAYESDGWVTFPGGRAANGSTRPTSLFGLVAVGARITLQQFGADASGTAGGTQPATPVSLQTGVISMNTPLLSKELHQIFLEVNATAGVVLTCVVTPSSFIPQSDAAAYPAQAYPAQTVTFAATTNSLGGGEQNQILKATLKPFLRANAFRFLFTSATSPVNTPAQFEITSMVLDYIETAAEP